MKQYAMNSPEAMAHIVAMMIVTDGELHDDEISFLDRIDAFRYLGLSRSRFTEVARQYCSDLQHECDGEDRICLLDPARIDAIANRVTDPKKQEIVCAQLLGVIDADGDLHGSEAAVFRYVLNLWGMDADQFLEAESI
jgi:uncharacterized tellurite resistance protein B-like protein